MDTRSKSFAIYSDRIHKALDFINGHLGEKICLEDVAQAAFFSSYHFHRLFTGFIGETPDDYIRRLRLEKSARMLLSNNPFSITDIALYCGFSTQSLFSRNFKNHFGMSPSEWKSKNRQGKSKNTNEKKTCNSYIPVYEGVLDVEVINMSSFPVAFIRHLKGYTEATREMFARLVAWAKPRGLMVRDTKLISFHLDNPAVTPENKCRTYAGISLQKPVETKGDVSIMEIPAGMYAKARFRGEPQMINHFYRRLFREWVVYSGFYADDFPIYHVLINLPSSRSDSSFEFYSFIKIRSL